MNEVKQPNLSPYSHGFICVCGGDLIGGFDGVEYHCFAGRDLDVRHLWKRHADGWELLSTQTWNRETKVWE